MVVILGAGLTGLALARELAARGVDFLVLEAADEPGGVIRTVEAEGRLLELGPQRTRLTPQIAALIDALGLRDEVVTAPPGLPLWIYRDGRLRRAPFSLREAVGTDLLSWRAKARVLLEPLTGPEREGESVADFLVRKFGGEVYRSLLGPLYGGLYASDPSNMPMRHSLSAALRHLGVEGSLLVAMVRRGRGATEAAPACSFRGGLRALIDALHAAHRDRIRLGTAAHAVRAAGGGGYVVETTAGEVEADAVVVTIPADRAAAVLRPVAPDAADRLSRLVYNPLAIVHLAAECDVRGLGYQVAFGERLATRGVTFNASLFGRADVYTAFLGGALRPEVPEWPDDRLGEVAATEFEEVTGRPARPLRVSRVRMPAWDRSWSALEGLALPPGVHLAANYESRAGIPGRLARARALAERLAATTSP